MKTAQDTINALKQAMAESINPNEVRRVVDEVTADAFYIPLGSDELSIQFGFGDIDLFPTDDPLIYDFLPMIETDTVTLRYLLRVKTPDPEMCNLFLAALDLTRQRFIEEWEAVHGPREGWK